MSHRLRVVMAGCGGISRAWLDAIRNIPEIEMVGFVDINPEAAERRAREGGWPNALVGADLSCVLDSAEPDALFDCTIPEAHVDVTLTALAHGCHVLGEKPLADTMENARRMVAAARQADRIYAVIQNRRYDPNIRRLREFLISGVIGRITTVHCDFFIGAHFGGFRDHMRHVLLLDMAIHTFDAARFISGADPMIVSCTEWNPPGSWYDYDASAVAVFGMTDDIVYTYRGSWCAEGLNTSWESTWRVIGTQGSVEWDGGEGFRAQVVSGTGGFIADLTDVTIPPHDAGEKVGGHAGVIREFVQCVQAGTVPETVCTDNIRSLSMVFGAIQSAEQGIRIAVKDL
ncbi:MAG: Gfo/Idh/MocA family oxidoreductase [Chloroflexi bacterium]|nr:Gfo/Idh/MocA family oxidoreductase [Chloroflexota bacterium]